MADLLLASIPVGDTAEDVVAWLKRNGGTVFDATKDFLTWLYEGLSDLLTWPPALVFAVLVGLLAWRVRNQTFGVIATLGLLLVDNLGLWDDTMLTLSLVLIAAALAVIVGVPIGIAAARSGAVSTLTKPVLDVMQTMPAFVYLIPAVSFFRIGPVPGIMATVVFAMPPAVRLTELGIRQVDAEVVEASHAFGASPRRILGTVQLPLALPTIMAGVNQVIMLSLSMVVVAGMIGAQGLGGIVYTSVTRLDIGKGFEAGLAVVIIAVVLDRLTSALAARTPGGRRAARRRVPSTA